MLILPLFAVSLTTLVIHADPIATDGLFGEWYPDLVVATDPMGDSSGAFDITSVSGVGFGSELRIRFDVGSLVNLPAGEGADGIFRIELGMPSESLTLDLRNRTAYAGGNPGNFVPWVDIGFAAAPTYASIEYEAVIELSTYGIAEGDSVTIDFSGSDSLDAPALITMGPARLAAFRRSADRLPKTDFRIMSINTKGSGLTNAARGPGIQRIIDAVDADIYCFQEESSSNATVAATLGVIDPFDDGASWNVTKNGSNSIASRSPVLSLPEGNSRYVAAIVELSSGPIVVFGIHPSCCGYIGNSQDNSRISQTAAMVQTITDLRNGDLGPAYFSFANAPVMVIGDYNLVGSRTPLDMLEAEPLPKLRRRLLRNLVGDSPVTWYDYSSSFWPGQLDLVTYSPDLLMPRNGFVFDTNELNASELTAMGLQTSDSDGSDHLTLIADFTMEVDVDDLYEQHQDPIDWNGDGMVDLDDQRDLESYLRRHELEDLIGGRR